MSSSQEHERWHEMPSGRAASPNQTHGGLGADLGTDLDGVESVESRQRGRDGEDPGAQEQEHCVLPNSSGAPRRHLRHCQLTHQSQPADTGHRWDVMFGDRCVRREILTRRDLGSPAVVSCVRRMCRRGGREPGRARSRRLASSSLQRIRLAQTVHALLGRVRLGCPMEGREMRPLLAGAPPGV